MTPALGGHTYAYGESVAVTAIPADGWVLSEWRGLGIADIEAPQTTVMMDSNKSIVACFRKKHEVKTLAELQAVQNDLDGHYILMNDIDASETTTWNNGGGFYPIGSAATPFTGAFDGNGKTITGLVINRPTAENVGLFGYTAQGGSIKNLALAGGSVTGKNYVGGLVGFQSDVNTIKVCCATCNVSGVNMCAGGLVGFSYGAVVDSYYDSQTSGQSDTGGTAKTTAEMKQQATFVGWNFDTVWMINEGLSYPYFFDTSKPQTKTVTEVPCALTFKLSQTRNLTMDITGVAAGATITVQCLKAAEFSAPNPPFKHAENLYKEKLAITGTGLEGLNATLTWNLDSGLYAEGTAPDKVYRVSEGAIANEYAVTASDNAVTISGVTGFSDWYAGESTAVPVTLSGLELE